MGAEWKPVLALEELDPAGVRAVKVGGRQLAVGRDGEGAVFALDNHCPHEGYPLAQGDLAGCTLTCAWHNWKFDVRDGSCILGGEAVRAYPVRVRAGRVEVDLAEPDPAVLIPSLLASFEEGLRRHENDRAIRDGVRLLQAGYPAARLLADVALYDARHAEYGSTHALAVAADCGRLLGRYTGVEAMYAVAPALDLCGESNRRLPRRRQAEPIALTAADIEGAGAALAEAVEREDAERAEGLLLGAFDAGVERATIEGWLYRVLSRHFTDFGHQLIYLVKAQELLGRVGPEYARDIHAALLYGTVLATREDTLPYMRGWFRRLGAVEPELEGVHRRARAQTPFDPAATRDAVLSGTPDEAFDAVWEPLREGVPGREVACALVGAAAHRLDRFDLAIERDPLVAESWLWATHRLTFASAARNAQERLDAPEALRFLFQAAAFVHGARALDVALEQHVEPEPIEAEAGEVVAAITDGERELAVARVKGYLASERPLDELARALEDLCLADPLVRPIVVAHALKTTFAALEEVRALAPDHPDRERPLVAAVRFLASPVIERRVAQTVATSIRWVARGEIPRKLTQ